MGKKFYLIALTILIIFGSVLRITNLGYSDYQGDEIKAFFNPAEDGDYIQFLLDQRKGPNQFIVTGFLKGITNNFDNYFLTRLPFALAGIVSIYIFYLITKRITNERLSIIATIFFVTNGFLVAFSRIVQYQSFVILFGLLGIYLYQIYRDKQQFKFIYLSFVSFAISILFHYDGVFFGIPVFIYFLQDFLKAKKNTTNFKKSFYLHTGGAVTSFLAILLTFYIPFILNISEKTLAYWGGRLSGEVSSKISSSYYLFTVYQPIYAVHFYVLLSVIGLFLIFLPILQKLFQKNLPKNFPILTIDQGMLIVFIWTLIPFIFMEGLVSIPGTHIYTYLIPIFILMAYGIDFILTQLENNEKILLQRIGIIGISLLGIFLYLQSYEAFVDHSRGEYPWQDKKFLFFTMNRPTPMYHLSMFGFPYYRNWKEAGEFVNSTDKYYTTNDRVTITRYYIKLRKDGDKIGYYMFSKSPQTFSDELSNSRVKKWVAKGNKPIKIIENPSGNNLEIYLLPEDFEKPMPKNATEIKVEEIGNDGE